MLVYLTNNFFNEDHRRQSQTDILKIKYMNTISRFQEHAQQYDDLGYFLMVELIVVNLPMIMEMYLPYKN